jgi:hypothetical protein
MAEMNVAAPTNRASWTTLGLSLLVVAIMVLSSLAVITAAGAFAPVSATPSSATGSPGATAPSPPAQTAQPPLKAPSTPASSASSAPNLANIKIKSPDNLQSVLPQSWGGAKAPPGAPVPTVLQNAVNSAAKSGNWQQENSLLSNWCDGLWPANTAPGGAQALYLAGCYGHDEPGLDPYSNLPGSGGNVTWNVTLPVDRSATQNQSNLYAAIWFGMTLSDPQGWMNQCFLELQFYPDSSFNVPVGTVAGQWVGAAVAWQIDLANGFEDPCFYEPLYLNTTTNTFFNMTQGDSITVTMSGWVGSPWGENITVMDNTQGISTQVNLRYNQGGPNQGAPLDPAYVANDVPGAMQWTPGGELPIAFSFETGHAANPTIPENNQYGGCSAGQPGVVPSTPCPSYDPGSWSNDTLQPWTFQPPTFFNDYGGHMTYQTATEVGFTQPEGAYNLIDQTSLGTCVYGSAWCTYPWYSWYGSKGVFEFGATNYAGVTDDFGQAFGEFNSTVYTPATGLGYYYPHFFPIPGANEQTVVASATSSATLGGSIIVAGTTISTPTGTATLKLQPGVYSLVANNVTGTSFTGWTATGGVTVAEPMSPVTSMTVGTTPGTIIGTFGAQSTAPTSTVYFNTMSPSVPSWTTLTLGEGIGAQSIAIPNGGSMALTPGVYTIQGMPGATALFQGWNASTGLKNNVTYLTQTVFPVSLLVVGANAQNVYVNASYKGVSTMTSLSVIFSLPGSGMVNVTGIPGTPYADFYPSSGPMTLPVGSYNLTYTAAPGYALYSWSYYLGSIVVTNQSGLYLGTGVPATQATIQLTLEQGAAAIEIQSFAYTNVTLAVNPVAGSGNFLIVAPYSYSIGKTQYLVNAPNPYAVLGYPGYGGTFWHYSFTSGESLAFYDLTGNDSWPVWALPALDGTTANTANMTFVDWGMTGGPGAMVMSTTQPATTLMTYASAATTTLWLNFTAATPPGFQQTISVSPSGAGDVCFNSYAFSCPFITTSGKVYTPNGTYPILAFSLTESFAGWTTTGGINVMSNAPLTYAVVTGPGTLTANFLPLPSSPVDVTLIASDPATTTFTVNGGSSTITSGSYVVMTPGVSYTVKATVASGSTFEGWNVSDNGAFTGYTTSTNTITFTPESPGTIYAIVSQSFEVAPATIVNNAIDLGMNTSFSAFAVGAPGTISAYTWTGLPAGCSGTTAVITCKPTAAGAFSVSYTATSGTVTSPASSPSPLTVAPLPTVTVGYSGAVKMNGFPLTIYANVTGGTGPYTYDYTSLPAGCSTVNAPMLTCVPSAGGLVYLNVTVTDAYSNSAKGTTTVNLHNTAVNVVTPASGYYEFSGVIDMPLTWTTSVTNASDLSLLTETISLSTTTASGATLFYNTSGVSTPNLFYSPPKATESTFFTAASDLALPHQSSQLPYGVYTLTIWVWNDNACIPTTGLPCNLITSASITVVHSETPVVTPDGGLSIAPGNVSLAYSYIRPELTSAVLSLYELNITGNNLLLNESVISPTGYGSGAVTIQLAPGTYHATLTTYSSALGTYLNGTAWFRVTAGISGGTVYRNTTTTINNYNNATLSVGGLNPRTLGTILIVVGIIIGIIVGLAVAMLTRPKPEATAPQAWQGSSTQGGTTGDFACPTCGAKFPDQASLEEHGKTAHGSS